MGWSPLAMRHPVEAMVAAALRAGRVLRIAAGFHRLRADRIDTMVVRQHPWRVIGWPSDGG